MILWRIRVGICVSRLLRVEASCFWVVVWGLRASCRRSPIICFGLGLSLARRVASLVRGWVGWIGLVAR